MQVITIWSIESESHTTYANSNNLDDVSQAPLTIIVDLLLSMKYIYTAKHSMVKSFVVRIENHC